jgi:protein gp37
MSNHSPIEWTDWTWNPTVGCTRVTAGCDHCYAFALHDMRHACYEANQGSWSPGGRAMPAQYAHPFSAVRLLPERLGDPFALKKPKRIFVNSMSDLFHSQVPFDYLEQVFRTMAQAHWHTFQILTKRVGRLSRLAPDLRWSPNIWIGVSIETDPLTARTRALQQVPTPNRFLSLEPLLEPLPSLSLEGIAWVIVGGESGPAARPMHPEWVRVIRNQCVAAHVPFFFKQWGGRTPKAGGRLLDGRTWDELPEDKP